MPLSMAKREPSSSIPAPTFRSLAKSQARGLTGVLQRSEAPSSGRSGSPGKAPTGASLDLMCLSERSSQSIARVRERHKPMPHCIEPRQHLVAVVAYEGLGTFEYGIAAEIFGQNRPDVGSNWYRLITVAVTAGPLRAIGGIWFEADFSIDALEVADTIVLPGWTGPDVPVPAALTEALRQAHERGARLVSICTGAFILAAAGLLDGLRAATHWHYAQQLAVKYPAVRVDPDVLYIDNNPIFTSAGSAAGIDLLLHIVRLDHGPQKANAVARSLVMAPHRQGGQAQFIERPMPLVEHSRLAPLLDRV